MAKKNLKAALASHTAKQAAKAHQQKVEAAQARKSESVKQATKGGGGSGGGAVNKKKRRKLEQQQQQAEVSGATHQGDTLQAGTIDKGKGKATPTGGAGKSKTVNPFAKDDTVLLVGEGDFSFTRALLSPPFSHSATRILTTSFDSEQSCLEKYPTAADNIAAIRGACPSDVDPIRFSVDAGDLLKDKTIRKWKEQSGGFNRIYFGFPHVGQGHKDESRNVLANQLLLLRFFVSAASLLSSGPKPQYALSNEQGVKKRKAEEVQEDLDDGVDRDPADEDTFSDVDPEDDLLSGRDSLSERRNTAGSWPPRSSPRAGSILVSLRESKPYTLWSLPSLATRLTSMLPSIASSAPALPKGLKAPTLADVHTHLPEPSVPVPKPKVKGEPPSKPRQKDRGYDTWRSFRFYPSDWRGYKHVRTVGYDERDKDLLGKEGTGESGNDAEAVCRMWEFGLRT